MSDTSNSTQSREDILSALREASYRWLDSSRIPHVAGCEKEAVNLAERWGADAFDAARAGILHDVTKNLLHIEQLQLCDRYDIVCTEGEKSAPKLMHALTGAAVAENEFGMPENIVNAIRWHTTGRPCMTLLEKIIYLADYIEPTRDFPGVEKLRALAYENLDACMALALEMSVEEVRSYGTEPYIDTISARDYYRLLIQ